MLNHHAGVKNVKLGSLVWGSKVRDDSACGDFLPLNFCTELIDPCATPILWFSTGSPCVVVRRLPNLVVATGSMCVYSTSDSS